MISFFFRFKMFQASFFFFFFFFFDPQVQDKEFVLAELFLFEPNRLFRKGAGHKQNGSTIDCLLVFFLHFDRNSICEVLLLCSRSGDWQPGTFG